MKTLIPIGDFLVYPWYFEWTAWMLRIFRALSGLSGIYCVAIRAPWSFRVRGNLSDVGMRPPGSCV